MTDQLPTSQNNGLAIVDKARLDTLYETVSGYIEQARLAVRRSIDHEMIKAYWLTGEKIVEEEQHGQSRAEYGKAILKNLSEKLQATYNRGFSVDVLEKARKFFILYQENNITQKSATLSRKSVPTFSPNLSWSHYVELIKISRSQARQFYELEASRNCWSVRELKRQVGSLLFDRLSKSKDKEGLLKLALKGQGLDKPEDAIKEPLVLEFLGLPESHRLVESKLEEALVNNLQHFLLELGKGFAFVARQKRLTLDNDHFYADLVMYHIILKCYVIIDIKCQPLTHADLGQMQLYVNYFDQQIKMDNDNPTIGLVLCTSKNDAMVKYLLGDRAKQIFASTYQFHLPTVEELTAELKREVEAIQQQDTNDAN